MEEEEEEEEIKEATNQQEPYSLLAVVPRTRLQFPLSPSQQIIPGFTTNEQGDSPPFIDGQQRKKKVTISVEMNDILPSQNDNSIDEGEDEMHHESDANDANLL